MKDIASIINALAALIGSIAWPSLFLILFLWIRKPLLLVLQQVPGLIGRTKTAKLGWLEFELEKQAITATSAGDEGRGEISPAQIRSAAKIKLASQAYPAEELRAQLDRLSFEYSSIRSVMKPGPERTAAMDSVIAQMRSIGPAIASWLDKLKVSQEPGDRLAAIAIMQMEPDLLDPAWILERFKSETPFVFYHAALALEYAARTNVRTDTDYQDVATQALDIISRFEGTPDRATIDVLNGIAGEVY